jgi:hypothetical protein
LELDSGGEFPAGFDIPPRGSLIFSRNLSKEAMSPKALARAARLLAHGETARCDRSWRRPHDHAQGAPLRLRLNNKQAMKTGPQAGPFF